MLNDLHCKNIARIISRWVTMRQVPIDFGEDKEDWEGPPDEPRPLSDCFEIEKEILDHAIETYFRTVGISRDGQSLTERERSHQNRTSESLYSSPNEE